ncbi:hypothetical protein [Alsobacter sp. SYSU BS001988]
MSTPPLSRSPTLADVIAAVAASELPVRRRQDMVSAVRTVCRLLGREPDSVAADPRALALRLKAIAPQAAGLSPARWNNVRSLIRASLALVRPMMAGRSTTPMSVAWQGLYDVLPTKAERARLSRLLRWFSARQIDPAGVSAEHHQAFAQEIATDSLMRNPDGTWRDTVEAWNRCVRRVPGWPQTPIVRISRRDTYSLPWEAFPTSLKADADAWLDRLAGRDFADDGPSRPARPRTIATRAYQLRAFASALVQRGWEPASLSSLADLVTEKAFATGLRFFYDRGGGKTSSAIYSMASMLKGVARHWVKVDDPTLARMGKIVGKLAVPMQGLTEKNRTRLRAFGDEAAIAKLIGLPQLLRDEADRGKLPPRLAAVRAQLAVAIHILLVAPIRRENLAAIDCDRNLIQVGPRLHLVIPAADVKNAVDLEFELPASTVELIAWYREKHRDALAPPGCTALFPGAGGRSKTGGTLGAQITEIVFQRTGLKVNPHLFRHIGAKIFLDRQPGAYEVVRRVLGHKKMATTTSFYTGLETAAATRHFDEVILRQHEAASRIAPRRRGRRA